MNQAEQLLDDALRALLARDNRMPLQLDEHLHGDQIGMPEQSGEKLDQLIRDLLHEGWAGGHVTDTAPSGPQFASYWSGLRVTVNGLRHLGEWPGEGREPLTGHWDQGIWGQTDRPVLESLTDQVEDFVFKPTTDEPVERQHRWETFERLFEAGFVDADRQQGGLSDVRLTSSGRRVLTPPEDDPLRRAEVHLRHGAKADAVTAAVDEALKPRLYALAGSASIAVRTKRGAWKTTEQISEALEQAGVYPKWVDSAVKAWADVRSEVDHGRGANVADAWIATVIRGIGVFLDEYPVP